MKKVTSLLLSLMMMVVIFSCGSIVSFASDITYNQVTITPSTTDSYAAYHDIQTQLNLMKELNSDKNSKSGLKLIITPGTYYISTGLKIYSNTYLDLTGVTLVRDTGLTGKTMISVGQQGVSGDPATGYDYYRNITIHNGVLNSNNLTGTILKFHHTSNLKVEGTTFVNCAQYHDVGFAGCSNIVFDKCTFKDHKKVFTSTSSSYDNLEAIQLDILQEYHFPNLNPACYDGLTCKDISVTNCTFSDVYRGVGCHSVYVGKYMTGVNISNNTFNNVWGYAIIASNFIGAKIENNTITDCGSGILYRAYLPNGSNTYADANSPAPTLDSGTSISNNTITIKEHNDPSFIQWKYGIQVYGEKLTSDSGSIKAGDYRANNITVNNNTISMNVKGMPIWLRGVSNSTIDNNSISQSVAYSKNDVNAAKDAVVNQGICADACENVTISNNVIPGDNNIENGIQLKSSSSMKIVKNQISKAKENGILLLKKSSATISGNKISNSGDNGIRTYEGSRINTSKNTITKSKNYGIFLVSSQKTNVISGDTISNSSKYGINLQGSSATIKNVTVKNNSNNGIYLTQKSSATITNANILSNKGDGVYVTNSSNAVVSNSTIKNAGKNGICVYKNCRIKTSKNTIVSPKQYGIFLVSSTKSNVISGDSITGASKYGINLQGSNSTIKGVKIKNTSGTGIYLTQASNATISKAKVLSSKADGIYVTNSSVANVSNSTISSNNGNGLYFTNKGKGSVTGSTINDNSKCGIYKTGAGGKVANSSNTFSGNKEGKKSFH